MLIDLRPETEKVYRRPIRLMGNRFEISVVAEEPTVAEQCIDAAVAEIQRIESLLTTFKDDSQTNQINKNAGIAPVSVDREVFNIIERSIRISELTQGAFDITYGSVDRRLWNFDVNMTSLPDVEAAKAAIRLINYRNIILDARACTVMLKENGMRIGFGGIGKGYAADRARNVLQRMGINSGVVNASGDLTVWGAQPGGKPWTIGIADPDTQLTPFSKLNITNTAVATSGNYEKFTTINGKKYSHTIDPKTGMPIHGIKSVTVICPNAEIADALTTPVMVMGVKAGLHMINQMQKIACIIIDDNNQLYTSDNIKLVQ